MFVWISLVYCNKKSETIIWSCPYFLLRINFIRIHLRLSAFYLAHGPNGIHIESFFFLVNATVNGINASIVLLMSIVNCKAWTVKQRWQTTILRYLWIQFPSHFFIYILVHLDIFRPMYISNTHTITSIVCQVFDANIVLISFTCHTILYFHLFVFILFA